MEVLVNASLEQELDKRNSSLLLWLYQEAEYSPAETPLVYGYFYTSFGLSTHGHFAEGQPPMYDFLSTYSTLAVVNLRTGALLGQVNMIEDLSITEVLEWVDSANL